MNRKLATLGIGALLVGAVACASGGKTSGTSPPASTAVSTSSSAAAAATTAAAPAAAGPQTSFGDGTYEVGKDIAAGKYTTTVAPDAGCYWERLKGFSGGFDDIIANGNSGGGKIIITIAATDKGFKSSGCGTWTKS